jgi:REP element-mobilizing transposase RayT
MKNRKVIRLQWYDYSLPWLYFVTICTKNKNHFFGVIENECMRLNELWKFCDDEIKNIWNRKNIKIHAYVVMPNHVHFILMINGYMWCRDDSKNRPNRICKNDFLCETDGLSNHPYVDKYKWPTLWSLIKLFKWNVTKYANKYDIVFARQSRFYDHIIRNEKSYKKIINYIQTNAENWKDDVYW